MGSKVGWIISGVMVLLFFIAVVIPVAFPSPSKPIKALELGFLDLYKLPELSTIVDTLPSSAGNAGDDYKQALSVYATNKDEVDEFIAGFAAMPAPTILPGSVQELVDLVEQGSRKASMKYVFIHTEKELSVRRFYKPADDMNLLANALVCTSYFHQNRGEKDRQIELLKVLGIMGWHLYEERAHPAMMAYGLGFMMDSASGLLQRYNDDGLTTEAAQAEVFSKAVIALEQKFNDKMNVVWNTSPHAGDVFYIAEKDADTAWRVRAILSLGILKFTSTGADRRYNKNLILKFMKDGDVKIAAAARAARHLMYSEFNTLASDQR